MIDHYKVKVSLEKHEGKLERVFLIDTAIDLFAFSVFVLASFRADFAHQWMIKVGDEKYVLPGLEEDYQAKSLHSRPLYDLVYSDENKFKLIYDFGDEYVFNCKVYSKEVEFPLLMQAIIIEAEGFGIFEDGHYELENFLESGKLKKGYHPFNAPEDFEADMFDDEIDVQLLNDEMYDRASSMFTNFEEDDEDDFGFYDDDEEDDLDFDA